jgi:hypothetical protein
MNQFGFNRNDTHWLNVLNTAEQLGKFRSIKKEIGHSVTLAYAVEGVHNVYADTAGVLDSPTIVPNLYMVLDARVQSIEFDDGSKYEVMDSFENKSRIRLKASTGMIEQMLLNGWNEELSANKQQVFTKVNTIMSKHLVKIKKEAERDDFVFGQLNLKGKEKHIDILVFGHSPTVVSLQDEELVMLQEHWFQELGGQVESVAFEEIVTNNLSEKETIIEKPAVESRPTDVEYEKEYGYGVEGEHEYEQNIENQRELIENLPETVPDDQRWLLDEIGTGYDNTFDKTIEFISFEELANNEMRKENIDELTV